MALRSSCSSRAGRAATCHIPTGCHAICHPLLATLPPVTPRVVRWRCARHAHHGQGLPLVVVS